MFICESFNENMYVHLHVLKRRCTTMCLGSHCLSTNHIVSVTVAPHFLSLTLCLRVNMIYPRSSQQSFRCAYHSFSFSPFLLSSSELPISLHSFSSSSLTWSCCGCPGFPLSFPNRCLPSPVRCSMASRAPHAGQRLRSLMQKKCVMLPGAYNGLTARLAAEAGFEGVYVSGAALSACQGVPDIGILGLEDFTRVISQAASVTSLPVLADADTGFGGPEMVRRTVFAYNQAGAAGLHIEDQRLPKKCGHLEGKQLVSIEEMEEKIKAAAAASQDCSNGDFIICARTDARSVDGLDAAVERAVRYTAAGADMLFPEGLETEEEFQAFAHALAVLPGKAPFGGPYLLANMTEFGKTPIMELSTFEGLGYHCVIYPVSPLRVAMKSVKGMLVDLRKNGSVGHSLEKMYTRQELYSTLHYRPEGTWTYPSASVCMDKAVEDTEA